LDGGMSDIISEAKEKYKIATDGWHEIYDKAREDLRFTYDVDSGQWDEIVLKTRQGRPTITVNKLQKFVRQCRGDFGQNRPSMKVIPADDKADVRMAELYNAILRQIEYTSNAPVIYDTAYSYALSSSIGFFRITTEYSDEDTFNQDIKIKRIVNPFSVHLDPFATEFNFEDGNYGFVEELIDETDYKKRYPKSKIISFDGDKKLLGDWIQDNKIRLCEYYVKEYYKKKIGLVSDGQIVDLDKKNIELINADGQEVIREREINAHKVKWYKINGVEILEQTDWVGSGIPIIPMFGDEIVVDGKRYYLSYIRGAKGPQQMFNYWASAATENVMLTPKTPYILDHRQLKGFEKEWDDSNINPRIYMRYNAVAGIQKPAREPQTQVPAAIINMMQSTAYDIEDQLGSYAASKGETSNERSGKAILARITQSDKGTYTFVDNAGRSIIAGLKQIVELIPKIYDTPRALNILGENGERDIVQVNQPTVDNNGQPIITNDLSVGKYDVIATVGASFGSKREEMVRMLIESMQYAPMLAPVIAPMIFKYSDWPGAQEVASKIEQAVTAQQQAQTQQNVQTLGSRNIARQQITPQ
jgi:hypothetical protein